MCCRSQPQLRGEPAASTGLTWIGRVGARPGETRGTSVMV